MGSLCKSQVSLKDSERGVLALGKGFSGQRPRRRLCPLLSSTGLLGSPRGLLGRQDPSSAAELTEVH